MTKAEIDYVCRFQRLFPDHLMRRAAQEAKGECRAFRSFHQGRPMTQEDVDRTIDALKQYGKESPFWTMYEWCRSDSKRL